MRVAPCLLLITAVTVGLPGCAMFNKKKAPAKTTTPAADPLFPQAKAGPAPAADARAAADAPASPVVQTSTTSGILAGQVLDGLGRGPAEAYVLVTCLNQGGQPEKKPLDVAANAQGYFTIAGLLPGRHYQLTARARDGNHMLAGTTFATAPNPRVLIRISEDFVTKNTPPIPPPPPWPGLREDRGAAAQAEPPPPAKGADSPTAAVDPSWSAPGRRDGSGDPLAPHRAEAATTPVFTAHPENIADNRGWDGWARDVSPLAEIRGGPRNPGAASGADDPPPPPSGGPARVPSCALVRNQLINFALNDLDGQPWEFRQRWGKLVLLDFWGTWCLPCRQVIPHLEILQDRFRTAGLQVIGIAYESSGTPAEQRHLVDQVCQRLRINYKVLMGSDGCPVKSQFAVHGLPTLVLLDQNGWIVWRHEGALSADDLRDLEMRLQARLGPR